MRIAIRVEIPRARERLVLQLVDHGSDVVQRWQVTVTLAGWSKRFIDAHDAVAWFQECTHQVINLVAEGKL